jgi:hypothetical protein
MVRQETVLIPNHWSIGEDAAIQGCLDSNHTPNTLGLVTPSGITKSHDETTWLSFFNITGRCNQSSRQSGDGDET